MLIERKQYEENLKRFYYLKKKKISSKLYYPLYRITEGVLHILLFGIEMEHLLLFLIYILCSITCCIRGGEKHTVIWHLNTIWIIYSVTYSVLSVLNNDYNDLKFKFLFLSINNAAKSS